MDVGPCPRRVLAVLPNYMSARNFLFTAGGETVAQHAKLICAVPHILLDRLQLTSENISLVTLPASPKLLRSKIYAVREKFVPGIGYSGLAYRFNELQGFAGHRAKKVLSAEQQVREATAGNYVSKRYGRPFPRSRLLFDFLKQLYWFPSFIDHQAQRLIEAAQPDVVYIGQVQLKGMRDIVLAAKRNNVPVIGNIASWDQPTTKGPVSPVLDKYMVQSIWMKERLVNEHEISASKIKVTGWPQMDCYAEPVGTDQLNRCREQLGVPKNRAVILFGLNSPRLGQHEPKMAQELLRAIEAQPEAGWHLLIRPHPRVRHTLSLFDGLKNSSFVSFVSEDLDDLRQLRDQILLSNVVVSSFGSLALDATALGRPAIYLADGHDKPWSKLEHISAVTDTRAVPVVHSVKELLEVLNKFSKDSNYLSRERNELRQRHVAPLDGRAGERVANTILAAAGVRI